MDKKKPTGKPKKKGRFTDFIAFLALILSVLLLLAVPILTKFAGEMGNKIASVASTVADVLMVLAIALPAWYFARRRGAGCKALYVIFLIFFVVAIVLGYLL